MQMIDGKREQINKRKIQNFFYIAPTIIFISIISTFPLIYSLGVSTTNTILGQTSSFIGLGNYKSASLKDERSLSA